MSVTNIHNLFPDTLMYAVSYVDGTVLIPADKDAPTVVGVLDTKPESLPALLKKIMETTLCTRY